MRRTLLAAAVWGMLGTAAVRAQTPAPPAAPPSNSPAKPAASIDDDLLKDLLPAPERPSKRPATPVPAPPAKPTPKEKVEQRPLDEEGEDIGSSPTDRLRAVVAPLEQVVQRLEKGDSSTATRQQQQVVILQFDQLLARRPQPKPAAAGGEGAAGERPGGERPSEKPGTGKEQGGGDRSTEEPNQRDAETKSIDAASEFWGQLPPQVREQLRSALPEKFLPGYESLIEAYYRRIAERRRP